MEPSCYPRQHHRSTRHASGMQLVRAHASRMLCVASGQLLLVSARHNTRRIDRVDGETRGNCRLVIVLAAQHLTLLSDLYVPIGLSYSPNMGKTTSHPRTRVTNICLPPKLDKLASLAQMHKKGDRPRNLQTMDRSIRANQQLGCAQIPG